jgi:hypothetical protein
MNNKTSAYVFVFGTDMQLIKKSIITLELPQRLNTMIASHYGRIRVDGERYYFRGTLSLHPTNSEFYIPLVLSGEKLTPTYNQQIFDKVTSSF